MTSPGDVNRKAEEGAHLQADDRSKRATKRKSS